MAGDWRPALPLAALSEGSLATAELAGLKLILARAGDAVVAYEDACPHEGYRLSDGDVEDGIIVCAKHLWEFEVLTGHHVTRLPRPENDLNGFPTRIRDGMVEVDLAAPSRPGRSFPTGPALPLS